MSFYATDLLSLHSYGFRVSRVPVAQWRRNEKEFSLMTINSAQAR